MTKDGFSVAQRWDSLDELLLCQTFLQRARGEGRTICDGFEEYLAERRETHDAIAYYDDHGEWFEDDALRGDEVDDPLSMEPNQCYYNCQTRIGPELTYCEGYAVQRNGRQAVPHAWLERDDGWVIEPTPTIAPIDNHYYGVHFESVDVTEAMIRREQADPIVDAICDGTIADPHSE